MIGIRILAAAVLAALAAAPAEAARQAKPAPEPPPFPQHGDRFFLSVRGPTEGGRAGLTCGTVDQRGREKILLQAPGNAYRDRDGFTGTWLPLGSGRYGESQMRTWSVTCQDGEEVEVSMSGPCPSGGGQVNTGD